MTKFAISTKLFQEFKWIELPEEDFGDSDSVKYIINGKII